MSDQINSGSITQTDDGPQTTESAAGVARYLALLASLGLLASFTSVFYHVTNLVGTSHWLIGVVVGTLLIATAGASLVRVRTAVGLALLAIGIGLSLYLSAVPQVYAATMLPRASAAVLTFLTGHSVTRIIEVDLWAISMAPAPVFLTWYTAVRRRYDFSAWIGGLTLGVFTLTGDAGSTTTLIGVTSALAVLGFGRLDLTSASWEQLQNLGLTLVAAVLLSRVLPNLPTKRTMQTPIAVGGGRGRSATLEGGLLSADERVDILGSITLSATPRFTVTAERAALWHAGTYDRYTGDGWIRSGETEPYTSPRSAPPGETTRVQQQFRAESEIQTMPAAWKPIRITADPPEPVSVSRAGDLQPAQPFAAGEAYTVVSEIPTWSETRLREAGTDYPTVVRQRYLQLPESTPARVRRRARTLTAPAEMPYEIALLIEQWLEANKAYSLDIQRPNGDIVDAFMFKMERGYCVYFATAMTVMLRTLGIPARFAVGYLPGERLAEDQWLVRGVHSHAWVEVYFPAIGWVPFDPTPAEPRRAAEVTRLDRDRSASVTTNERNRLASTEQTPLATSTSASATLTSTSTPSSSPSTSTPAPATTTAPPPPPRSPSSPRTADTPVSKSNRSTPSNQSAAVSRETHSQSRPVPTSATTASPEAPSEPELVAGGAATNPAVVPSSTPAPNGCQAEGVLPGSGPVTDLWIARDRLALVASVAGVVLGAYRFELVNSVVRALRLHWQRPTESSEADAGRAFARLERLLARRYRERHPGETARGYLSALESEHEDTEEEEKMGRRKRIDPRAHRVVEIYERAHYAGSVSRGEADEAIELVNDLVEEYGRFYSLLLT